MEVFLDPAAVSLGFPLSAVGPPPTEIGTGENSGASAESDFLATLQWFQQQLATSTPSPAATQPMADASSDPEGAISEDMEDSEADKVDTSVYATVIPFGWMPRAAERADQPEKAAAVTGDVTSDDQAISRLPMPTTAQPVFSSPVSHGKPRAPTGDLLEAPAPKAAGRADHPPESASEATANSTPGGPNADSADSVAGTDSKAGAEALPRKTAAISQTVSERTTQPTPIMAKAQGRQEDGWTALRTATQPASANDLPKQEAPPAFMVTVKPPGDPPRPESMEFLPTPEPAVFSKQPNSSSQPAFENLLDQLVEGKAHSAGERVEATPSHPPETTSRRNPPSLDRGMQLGRQVNPSTDATGPAVDKAISFTPAPQPDRQPALAAASDQHQPRDGMVKPLQREDKPTGREGIWATAGAPRPADQVLLETKPPAKVAEPVPVQIAQHVKIMVKEGKQTLQVKLNPEGCGEVTLHLEMTEGTLSVDIRTSLSSTKTMIEDQLSELKQALVSHQIPVSDIQVSCDSSQPTALPRFDLFGNSYSGDARGGQDARQQFARQQEGARQFRQPREVTHTSLQDYQWGRFNRRI